MPTEQQDLFGVRPGPVPGVLRYDVPSQPRDTSEAAANRIRPKAATIRQQVLGFLRGRGSDGATDRDIFDAVRMFHPDILEGTVRARRCELTRDERNPDGPVEAGTARRGGMTVWVVSSTHGLRSAERPLDADKLPPMVGTLNLETSKDGKEKYEQTKAE